MSERVAALALLSLTDADAHVVLADAVLEAGWFDARVMQVLWPIGRAKRNGERGASAKQRRARDRAAWMTGYPEFFRSFAAQPTRLWARAIAAVVLCAGWQKGRWALPARCQQICRWTDATVSFDAVRLTGANRDE